MKKGCGCESVNVWVCWPSIPPRNYANPRIYPWEAAIKCQPMTLVVGFLPLPSGRGKKKEAALPQHYLSPNQIKPNYIFRKTSSNP